MYEISLMSDKSHVEQYPEPSDARPTHSEDGVDLTLIRWMLPLTPEERIKALEDNVYALKRLRNAIMGGRR